MKRAFDLACIVIFVFLAFCLWSITKPAHAQEYLPNAFVPHELPDPGMMMCYPIFGYCVARIEDQNAARACVRNAPRIIAGLEERLKKLGEIKGCAKTEVTEPSKAPKPELKIETRDQS